MNRRSFLKSLILGLAVLVPPERDNMEIGEILKKMGRATLTNAEQEALRLWGNQTQLNNANVGSWTNYGRGFFLNDKRPDQLSMLSDHPAIKVYRNTNQSIPNADYTNCQFTANELPDGMDTTGWVDLVADNENVTIQEDGLYLSLAQIRYATNATGLREIELNDDSAQTLVGRSSTRAVDGAATSVSCGGVFYWPVGTKVYLRAWQNSGGALNIDTAILCIVRLRNKAGY